MIKKIDKIMLQAFLGPFVITLSVVVFILLTQNMVGFMEDLVGKDLTFDVIGQLMFYFALNLVPLALPLAILIASLITFGNLGEHYELTAIKSAGISLLRVLVPIFIISLLLVVASFWFSNKVMPWANLKAYSLLYDIRQKKPSLDLKEGAFYAGLPGYSVRVSKKLADGQGLQDVIIYNHTKDRGNNELYVAKSGKMYTIKNDTYLVLELFDGKSYHQNFGENNTPMTDEFMRSVFDKNKIVFSLESFDLKRTDENLFSSNKVMRNVSQLNGDIDSLQRSEQKQLSSMYASITPYYRYKFADRNDTVFQIRRQKAQTLKDWQEEVASLDPYESFEQALNQKQLLEQAYNEARNLQSLVNTRQMMYHNTHRDKNSFTIEKWRKFTQAFACFTMFLIGAPLGSIIKKGGLGVPILISILFFVLLYIMTMTGEKWAKEDVVPVLVGMWMPHLLMLGVGLFFLRQARNDSRLLEADAYYVLFNRIKGYFVRQKNKDIIAS
ncbi:LptF/LptG family permease [Eisenibacter elegans]|uniref:LptF/LptG family permease n=1 Tax=Eisenibacter elegans TaxID=997 RepID=UPI0006864882|nr:LptF/LptG family permease [Eisenibacter elegans]